MRCQKALLIASCNNQALAYTQHFGLAVRQSVSHSALQVTAPEVNSTVLLDEYSNNIRVEWDVPTDTENTPVVIALMRGDDEEQLEQVVNAQDSGVENNGVHEFELTRTLSRFSACNYTFKVSVMGEIAYSPYFTILNSLDEGVQPGTVCPAQQGLTRPNGLTPTPSPTPTPTPTPSPDPTPTPTPTPNPNDDKNDLSAPELAGIIVGIVCSILGLAAWVVERRYGCISKRRTHYKYHSENSSDMVMHDNSNAADVVGAASHVVQSPRIDGSGRPWKAEGQVAEMERSAAPNCQQVRSSDYGMR